MIHSYDEIVDKKFRIFISSTFSDMHQERDILVSSIFPKLRKKFSKYMIDITEIDLRWGISEDDAENSRVLEICIGEVLRCRPFFIGIIGNRYGTLASKEEIDKLPPAYREAIGEDIPEGISLTELEIRARLLNITNKEYVAFYKKDAVENETVKDTSIQTLLDRIGNDFEIDHYTSLEQFEQMLYERLTEFVRSLLPDTNITPFNDECYFSHIRILKENVDKYCADRMFIAHIEHLMSERNKVYICGEKGTGKSACISWLIHREGVQRDGNVFFHYATADTQSQKMENVFSRVRKYLESVTGISSTENDDHTAITEILMNNKLPFRITMFFDAVELYTDIVAIYKLFALADLNSNICVVCSGTQKQYNIGGVEVVDVKSLTTEQKRQIVIGTLKKHGKKLDNASLMKIVNNSNCSNPLFLNAFINQIRIFGSYEKFDAFLSSLLVSSDFGELMEIMISRLEAYFVQRNFDVEQIYKSLALIVYSNHGITENEIQEIVGVPPVVKSIFLSTIELFIIDNMGVIRFNHDLIFERVRKILDEREFDYDLWARNELIKYYENSDNTWRSYSELPYQLFHQNNVEKLAEVIKNRDCFMYLLENEKYSLISYMIVLIGMQHELYNELEHVFFEADIDEIMNILSESGWHYTVITIYSKLDDADKEKVNIRDNYCRAQYELAQDNHKYSIAAYEEWLELYKKLYPDDHIGYATRLSRLGGAYKSSGRLDKAFDLYERSVSVLFDNDVMTADAAWSMDIYGSSCYGKGELFKAVEVFERAVDICKKLYGDISTELGWAYCYSWATFYYLGEITQATDMAMQAYSIYDRIFEGHGAKVAWAAANAGIAKMIDGEYEKAESLLQLSIYENNAYIDEAMRPHAYSITAYCNLASVYEIMENHDKALDMSDFTLNNAIKRYGETHVYTANILLVDGVLRREADKIYKAIDIYEMRNSITPDIFYAKVCLSRIEYLNGNIDKAKEIITVCSEEYFSDYRETELISYLIYESVEKIVGTINDEIDNLYRFADYKFYLFHNNASNIAYIPEI